MAFTKKVWEDRQSEYPNRRKLKPTGTADTFDVARDEGLVVKEGNPFNAASMNDFETRVEAHTSDLSLHVTTLEKTMITNALQKTGDTMTAPLIAGGVQDLAVKQLRNMTISTADPSGGSNGDMWFKYS